MPRLEQGGLQDNRIWEKQHNHNCHCSLKHFKQIEKCYLHICIHQSLHTCKRLFGVRGRVLHLKKAVAMSFRQSTALKGTRFCSTNYLKLVKAGIKYFGQLSTLEENRVCSPNHPMLAAHHIIQDWLPGELLLLYQLKCSVPKMRCNTLFEPSLSKNSDKGNIDDNNP